MNQSPASQSSRTRAAGALILVSYFAGFCAVVMACAGTYSAWQRHRIITRWPATPASIRACTLQRHYPFRRDGGGVSYTVACDVTFSPDDNGIARVMSTSRHAGSSGTNYTVGLAGIRTEYPERILSTWIDRHAPGTTLFLHRDPASGTPTFIGVDAVIDMNPVPAYFSGVVVFAVLALALALARHRLVHSSITPHAGLPESSSDPDTRY